MKKISTILLTIILATTTLFGQSIESNGFQPNNIQPDATASYQLTLIGLNGTIDPSIIPIPEGLQIVGRSSSSSYSIVNGKATSSKTLIYTVQADKEGTYTVPAWSIKAGNQTFAINEATLKVDKNAPQQATTARAFADPFGSMFTQQRQQANQAKEQMQSIESNLKNSTKLEINLKAQKIYIGQSVPCELVFSFDKHLLEEGYNLNQLKPEIKNADAFHCPEFSEKPIIDEDTNSSKVLIKYITAITPLKVGSYDLDFSAVGLFTRQMSAMDTFNMSIFDFGRGREIPFEINMDTLKVVVNPLPTEGKPTNFTGAIGQFSIGGVEVNPTVLSVGEPCSIFAKIIGSGNFPRIMEPTLQTNDDWKSYKAKTNFTDESNGLSNIGIKTFEYTVVPNKADLQFAPTILFNYFDPNTGKYVELKSKEISVSVAPTILSKRAIQKTQEKSEPAISEIIEEPLSTKDSRLISSAYFWIAQIAILAILIVFILVRKEILKRKNNPAYLKQLSAKKSALNYLQVASKYANEKNYTQFFKEATTSLQFALTASIQQEAKSLTLREAVDIMNNNNADSQQIDTVKQIFEGSDAIAFGGVQTSQIDIIELNDNLKLLHKTISKYI